MPSIGDDLNADNISWKYYGDQWNNYVNDPYQLNYGHHRADRRRVLQHLQPVPVRHVHHVAPGSGDRRTSRIRSNLYADIANGTLPAVSVVKPSGYVDGHPASSKLDLFEGFVQKIVDQVEASPLCKRHRHLHHLRRRRRLLRLRLRAAARLLRRRHPHPADRRLALSSSRGHISHEYADHVSILKFIERNWNLPPVTNRSRDNFPNPIAERVQSLCADEQPGHQRPVRFVRLRAALGSSPHLTKLTKWPAGLLTGGLFRGRHRTVAMAA